MTWPITKGDLTVFGQEWETGYGDASDPIVTYVAPVEWDETRFREEFEKFHIDEGLHPSHRYRNSFKEYLGREIRELREELENG